MSKRTESSTRNWTSSTNNVLAAMILLTIISSLFCPTLVSASAVHSPFQYYLYSASDLSQNGRSRRRMQNIISETNAFAGSHHSRATLVSSSTSKRKQQQQLEEQYPELSFRDLGPLGKTVAGVTEIAFAVLFEYLSGFMTGLIFGTVVGFPGFTFRPMEKGVRQPLLTELQQRFGRMNTRSMTWAKSFGSISAAFGGFGVAVKVIRNGQEDVWNNILSSAAAGAFFARKEGPQAMLRGALMYGGLIYLISGGGFGSRRQQLQEYTERPIREF